MTKWTNIHHKLPETQRQILLYSRLTESIQTGFYNLEKKQFFTNTMHEEKISYVSHWSEMPIKPKI